ncbi:hypothetical protein BDW60DRAFT_182540 [Aspergillus nidulans var. acristatus]
MLQSGSCPYSRCWWVGLAGLFSPATGVIGETGRLEDWETGDWGFGVTGFLIYAQGYMNLAVDG